MRKIIVMGALFLGFTAFFAFAGANKETPESGNKYIRFAWWGNTIRDKQTADVVSMFIEKNPGVVIDTEAVGWGGYWDKVNTQAATGNVPDIVQQSVYYIKEWVDKGQLLELTPYITKGTFNTSQISDTMLDLGRLNGGIYGIAMGVSIPGTCYDPAIVEKAGLPAIDSTKWTLKDFEDISNTVYRTTGVKTLPICPTEPRSGFEVFIRQGGSYFFSEDGKSLGFTADSPILREFWALQLRLLDSGALVSPDIAFVRTSMEEEPFPRGQTWNSFIASNQLVAYSQAAGRPVKMALAPIVPDAKRYGNFVQSTAYFCISSKSANPDLAMRFIDFFVNDTAVNDIVQGERGTPIPDNIRARLASQSADPVQKELFTFADLANQYSCPSGPLDPPGAVEVTALFRDITVQVLTKSVSIEEGSSKFVARANEILSAN